MGFHGHPRGERAQHLRWRLQPASLLRDFEQATLSNRSSVELIGIKGQNHDGGEFQREHAPEFKAHLSDEPAIQDILRPYRDMGFRFIWTGYCDPTGTEVSLAIERNAAAEARLRLLVEGPVEDDTPDERQMPLV